MKWDSSTREGFAREVMIKGMYYGAGDILHSWQQEYLVKMQPSNLALQVVGAETSTEVMRAEARDVSRDLSEKGPSLGCGSSLLPTCSSCSTK